MYLIFDTETTGLPGNRQAPVSDVINWPRIVQLAWKLCDKNGVEEESHSFLIKPDKYTIPRAATAIHGITTKKANKNGSQIKDVLELFQGSLKLSNNIVSHNLMFDEKVISAEFYRLGKKNIFKGKVKICTMKSSAQFCSLQGAYGSKWPTLSELHMCLFKKPIIGAHDASIDVAATAKSFFRMREIGLLEIPNNKIICYLSEIIDGYPSLTNKAEIKSIREKFNTTYQAIYELINLGLSISDFEYIFNFCDKWDFPPSLKSVAELFLAVNSDPWSFLELGLFIDDNKSFIIDRIEEGEKSNWFVKRDGQLILLQNKNVTTRICEKMRILLDNNFGSINILSNYLDGNDDAF